MTVAVVIPVYKEQLTYFELLSLKQCIKILGDHPIVFAAPQRLDLARYDIYFTDKLYSIERFEDLYFASIDGYNQLMLSPHFYKRFLKYKFILLYQLDAYVFRDELLYWCKHKYDFIGAPHFAHANRPGEYQFLKNYGLMLGRVNKLLHTDHKISNVGNGGFSLRRTRAFYYLLILLKNKVKKWGVHNEDGFFKYWGNVCYPLFRLPPDDIALKFSIELAPKESLEKLGGNLPFGCHAFEKHGWETLKPFIDP